jgi:hypothetical protein
MLCAQQDLLSEAGRLNYSGLGFLGDFLVKYKQTPNIIMSCQGDSILL